MKDGFRQSMAWLHTWLGLLVGWVLYFVYLTGTLGFIDKEIDYWMKPDRPYFSEPATQREQLALAQKRLQLVAPDAARWNVQLIGGREVSSLDIEWNEHSREGVTHGVSHRETLDPRSGESIDYGARATGGGQVLYKMHYQLAYIPYDKAILFIMCCTLVMFAAMVTGIIVHKNIFKDFFTFRPGKGQRSWLDGHNLLGVTALPFHLVITYTGLMFFTYQFMPSVPKLLYDERSGHSAYSQFYQGVYPPPPLVLPQPAHAGTPLVELAPLLDEADRLWSKELVTAVEVRNPGDANARVIIKPRETVSIAIPENRLVFDGTTGRLVQNYAGPKPYLAGKADQVMKGLHKGLFASWPLRILFLFMGLGGTAMIGTGLLLWANTRRTRLLAAHQPLHFGIRLVDRLNAGAIVGMPIAIAAYFWANRLLPVHMAARAEWEVHAMYLTMAAMFAYPMVRPPVRARVDMLWLCAAAYALLPVVNALTTSRHLGVSLTHGDWGMAGFDLAALACGIIAAAFATKVQRSSAIGTARRKSRPSAATVVATF